MVATNQPVLRIENGNSAGRELTPDIVHNARFELTEPGKAVLHGDTDYVKLNGIDLWLGGVHLFPNNLWRWDEASKTIASD